jgi:hypothetical protein
MTQLFPQTAYFSVTRVVGSRSRSQISTLQVHSLLRRYVHMSVSIELSRLVRQDIWFMYEIRDFRAHADSYCVFLDYDTVYSSLLSGYQRFGACKVSIFRRWRLHCYLNWHRAVWNVGTNISGDHNLCLDLQDKRLTPVFRFMTPCRLVGE